ncbi:MAG: hypothetical protein EXS69_02095 [Candidatus Zambryskibacteria bacterium]|nr:hypothetical protein [Candidatus Zambryskibacteria bacterium]
MLWWIGGVYMLIVMAVLFLVVWLVGFLTGFGGVLIHSLLFVGVALLLFSRVFKDDQSSGRTTPWS